MTAESSPLPSVRKMFRPDPGMMLFDIDLRSADAQVVAWEAGDDDLKAKFRAGVDIYKDAAKEVFGYKEVTEPVRQKMKTGIHAIDYFCKARTLAEHLGCTVHEAELFTNTWFGAHPLIPEWHRRTESELHKTRSVKNAWGYRRYYFDRLDNILPKALAYIGQSTVAVTVNHALVNIHKNLKECQLLLQNHDSLVGQTAIENCPAIYPKIVKEFSIPIPFKDPLIINCSMKVSPKSWGDVEKVTW